MPEGERLALPEMPFEYILRRSARGQVIEESIIVKGLSEERFTANVDKFGKWFLDREPLLKPEELPPGVEIPNKCPECGNDDPRRWYVNLQDRKPNLKCMECDHRVFVKLPKQKS